MDNSLQIPKTNYDDNIEPNFDIIVDKYKGYFQIKIKATTMLKRIGIDFFNEHVQVILTDLKEYLIKWNNAKIENVTDEIRLFAEIHAMDLIYNIPNKNISLDKHQLKLMIGSISDFLTEVKTIISSNNSNIKIIKLELQLDLITRTCKMDKIIKY